MEGFQFADGHSPPVLIHAGAEETVQKIIPKGDMIKHLRHLLLFGEGRIFKRDNGIVPVFRHAMQN
jgi:hypothetical protein